MIGNETLSSDPIKLWKFQEKIMKGTESLFKDIMAENFPNLRSDTDIQIHEAQIAQTDSTKRRLHWDL